MEVTNDNGCSWVQDLTEQEQPETCGIEDEDCEACGS